MSETTGAYQAEVEAARIELLRRVGPPMWKRVGWKPRDQRTVDPLDEARYFARQKDVDGVVLIPLSLLRAVVERRECSARRDFTRDEDGPTSWTTYAVCRVAEGHEGDHSNGYFGWKNTSASDDDRA